MISDWKMTLFGFAVLAMPAGIILAIFMSSPADQNDLPAPVPWTTVSVPPLPYLPPYTGPGVLCQDGTVSWSTGRGTCSHHGGER